MLDVKEELHDQDKVIQATLDQPIEIHLWEDLARSTDRDPSLGGSHQRGTVDSQL